MITLLKSIKMDSMITSAPIGYTMATHYENEPYSLTKIVECETCEGSGREFYSLCCGEIIIDKKCSHCGDHCVMVIHRCDNCKGEGEIEL